MRNKGVIVGVVILIVIVGVAGAGYFLMNSSKTDEIVEEEVSEREIKDVSADEIGLELSLRADKKAVFMTLSKLDGIESLEYEATFDAQVKDPESGEVLVVPRGSGGSLEIKANEKQIKREVILGTCSSGTCKYDKVISDVKFIIRINFSNGEIGSVEETLSF